MQYIRPLTLAGVLLELWPFEHFCHTHVLGLSFWNFTGVFYHGLKMCMCLFQNPEIIFFHFFTFSTFFFLSSNMMKVHDRRYLVSTSSLTVLCGSFWNLQVYLSLSRCAYAFFFQNPEIISPPPGDYRFPLCPSVCPSIRLSVHLIRFHFPDFFSKRFKISTPSLFYPGIHMYTINTSFIIHTHTHTHTHIYIYIYIYILSPDQSTLNQWPAHSDNVEYGGEHVLLQHYSQYACCFFSIFSTFIT